MSHFICKNHDSLIKFCESEHEEFAHLLLQGPDVFFMWIFDDNDSNWASQPNCNSITVSL